jgi:hypothetical protein
MNQNDYPKIPEGKYPAIYIGHTKCRWMDQDKLYLEFEITEEPYQGKRLAHYYNVRFSDDRDMVAVGFMSNFIRDYARLFDELPKRLDRVSLDVFKDRNYIVTAKTVRRDKQGRQLHDLVTYSKIDYLEID